MSLSVPEHNCLRHGSQRNSTINDLSPFPPNQSLQLILDFHDPHKINTSISSAVSLCVLWRLRLPLVLLFCNYLFPCRPKKTSFPRKRSLKITARSYSWLMTHTHNCRMDYIAQSMYFLYTILHTMYSNREYKLWQFHSFYHAYETHELQKTGQQRIHIIYIHAI